MSTELPAISHRVPELSSRITVEGLLYSSAAFDVYKAVGRNGGGRITVARLRFPLELNGPQAAEFATRARRVAAAELVVVQEVGVDPTGVAYAIRPSLEGVSLLSGRIEGAEAERRFLSAMRLIARAHEAGIFFGDLCPSSWWITRDGEVSFANPCGVPDNCGELLKSNLPTATTAAASGEWKELLSPEALSGATLSAASDVYSLGALGNKLLHGLMHSDRGSYLLPIVEAAMAADPLLRPPTASALLKQIQEARAEYTRSLTVRKKPDPRMRDGSTKAVVTTVGPAVDRAPVAASSEPQQAGSQPSWSSQSNSPAAPGLRPKSRPLIVGVLGTLIVVTFVLGTRMAAQQQGSRGFTSSEAQLEMVAGNAALENAVRILGAAQTQPEERQLELEKLTNSDDPLAHELLVRTALGARSETERLYAERAIVERARRLGMLRAAEVARSWLRKLAGDTLPPSYEPLLRVLNGSLPEKGRVDLAKQILAYEPELAASLAAALALDTERPEASVSFLADLIEQRYRRANNLPNENVGDPSGDPKTAAFQPRGHSLIALLLADRELSTQFADDLVQRRDQLTRADFPWILPILAERGDPSTRTIAALALSQNAFPPINQIFLELVRDRDEITPEQLQSLVRGAVGAVTHADIGVLGRWFDVGAERGLLAICASAPAGSAEALEAFDTLGGRSLITEPAASLVAWVRANRWNGRRDIIKPVAQVALADRQAPEDVIAILEKYAQSIANPAVLEVLVKASSAQLSALIVEKFRDNLGIGSLINLLSHPDSRVRIAAVSGLTQVNEAAILRIIVERYDREREPTVRKAYEDNLWVIKERVRR